MNFSFPALYLLKKKICKPKGGGSLILQSVFLQMTMLDSQDQNKQEFPEYVRCQLARVRREVKTHSPVFTTAQRDATVKRTPGCMEW